MPKMGQGLVLVLGWGSHLLTQVCHLHLCAFSLQGLPCSPGLTLCPLGGSLLCANHFQAGSLTATGMRIVPAWETCGPFFLLPPWQQGGAFA